MAARKTTQHSLDRGQGGWFKETREHREAALKGKARATHAQRASPRKEQERTRTAGQGSKGPEPPDHTGKRFLVFCDGMGSRSFDTPEEAKAFAKRRYETGRYGEVEVMDQETEDDIARFG